MSNQIKRIIATITAIITIIPSFFGISSVYDPYDNDLKYDPSLGQIIVDTDMSVPRIFITENGTSDYVIVRGANASPSEVTASQVLQDYLNQISGVFIPILTDSTAEQAKEIVVGKTNREGASTYTINREKLGYEGLNIFIYNEKLIIAGGEKRGTLYGVYTFLEDVLGCRWFTKDLTVVPNNEIISVRRSLYIEHIPVFENRDVYWASAFNEAFSVANKINGEVSRNLSDANGDGVKYGGAFFVHTFTMLLPESQYFASHPEYYAFTENGKREPTQPCLTNPEVLRIVTENVFSWIRANPNVDIVSVSQNDNTKYCQCDNCKAVDKEEDSNMGTLLRFVNAVAEEVEKEYPNVAIDTLAYQYTRKAPSITRPLDNVIIRLCSIEACFSHPLSECTTDETGRTFQEDIEDWQKICNRIYVWDYTTNFRHYSTPFPNFGVLQPNVQFFAENNVIGLFEQGCYQIENNGEFAQLRAYVLAKLLWDPYTDFERHMNEFMLAFYGEGYQYIRKYIDFTTNRGQKSHFHIFDHPAEMVFLTESDLKQCDKWWDAAEMAAKSQNELDNIQCSRLQVRYYKNYMRLGEYSLLKNKPEYGEALYDDLMRFGINRPMETKAYKPKDEIDFNRRIRLWR